jgi:2,4-dienoyl-CoA reductase (NADPH2)
VNPRACHETELTYAPTTVPKRLAVVGAGPAGMMAAIVAAERGHQVVVFDRADQVGGQLNLARKVPGKEEFDGLVTWFDTMLRKAGVVLRLGQEAQPNDLTGFDEVILATGVTPRDPQIPTDPGAKVFSYADILNGADPGRRVAVVGAGGIGFDVAEALVHHGQSPALDAALWRAEWGVSAPWTDRGGLAPKAQPRIPRPAKCICCNARRKSRGGVLARPPAGFTAPIWR